ncbi:MAG: NTPase [candidate division Zixibacteria bacterium]|nr:NTPase [candidate division Zixibacteria bacterium]
MMEMSSRKRVIITGLPGVGKTTVIRKIVEALKPSHPVGFYTAEIRDKGARKGFELIALDGRRGLLSHIDIKSQHRVGKYGVDIDAFETFLEAIDLLNPAHGVVIIDEIGKMECLSAKFRETIVRLFESDKTIIATAALAGGGLIEDVKHRPGVTVVEVTIHNRNTIAGEIINLQTR